MSQFFRADLHCHSCCSDGNLTPGELVTLAKSRGLQALSITDHDTTKAYETAPAAAAAAGLLLVSGVEFSTVHITTTVHLLVYSYALNAPPIEELCRRHLHRREGRNLAILERLSHHAITLTYSDLEAEAATGTTLGRPHIALALVRKGYVSSVKEAFLRYLGDHAPCYVQGEAITLEETIELAHEANAFAVLAHPHLLEDQKLIHSLLKLPLDGIEAYYGNLAPEQHKRWLLLADKHHLFITGGSDFHGVIRPHVPLGCAWTPESSFRHLYDRFLTNSNSSTPQ